MPLEHVIGVRVPARQLLSDAYREGSFCKIWQKRYGIGCIKSLDNLKIMRSPIVIKEKLSPSIKTALFSNFSNSYEAILEITDNSVSHRIPGKKLEITISFIGKKKFHIEDFGGEGMDLDALKFFFNWGGVRTRKNFDIGQYSQGGKAAIGYLGNSFELTTSPLKGESAYRVQDIDIAKTSKLKTYNVLKLPAKSTNGYTSIEISRLRFGPSDSFKNRLREILLNTYRPLIEQREVNFIFDGEMLKVSNFPLDEYFRIEKVNSAVRGEKLLGWIGRLASRSGIKGGIRCYYKGRLICDKEFFGHPDPTYKGTLNFLFGELYLDFVPVNTNKTDFNRNSPEWSEVQETMFKILQSHIDELLGRKIEEPTEEEIQRVKKTRDLFQEIMKLMNKKFEGSSENLLGDDHGRKTPEFKNFNSKEEEKKHLEEKRREYKPRTPPPENRVGIQRRLKRFMDWDTRSMEETIRSKIEERGTGKILIINNVFPGFKKSKGNDFYLLETAALQTVPIEDSTLTPQKYLEEFDRFFGMICEHMDEAKSVLSKRKQ